MNNTINSRIKFIRKELGYNQSKFAEMLGVGQTAISFLEKDGSTVTEQNIKAICKLLNVREEWIRAGIEPKFLQTSTFSLDDYIKKRGASELEIEILRAYFSMEPELRQSVISHFKAHLGQSRQKTTRD